MKIFYSNHSNYDIFKGLLFFWGGCCISDIFGMGVKIFYKLKINFVSFVELNQKYSTFSQRFDPPACRDHELWSKVH